MNSKIENKGNEAERIQLEIDFKEIYRFHQEKKKEKIVYDFKYSEFFLLTCLKKICKKKLKNKREIVEKAINITNSYMDIIFIIKEFMELNSVKRVILSDPQIKLLKYQNKYLNFQNPEETLKYLDSLGNKEKLEENIFDKEDQIDTDLKMCDGLIKYYNF